MMKFFIHTFCIACCFFAVCGCTEKAGSKNERKDSITLVDKNNIIHPALQNKYAIVDISPMDMCYFPPDYPQLKMAGIAKDEPVMRVIYSRPHLQGRTLFTDILKYGERWRLGANEATELTVFKPVNVNGKKLSIGRYTLYCIPQEDEWTIVVNSATDTWGLKQDTTKNLLQTVIPVTHNNPSLEYFTIVFEKTNTGANMIMAWDDVLAKLPFIF